jgi:hypothetical protein
MSTQVRTLLVVVAVFFSVGGTARGALLYANVLNVDDISFDPQGTAHVAAESTNGQGAGSATANYGHLQTIASAGFPGISSPLGAGHYVSLAYWADSMFFQFDNGPSQGTFQFALKPTYSVVVSSDSNQIDATAILNLHVNVNGVESHHSARKSTTAGSSSNMESGELLKFTVPYQVGVTVSIIVDILAEARSVYLHGTVAEDKMASALADMGNSLEWGGILEVRDELGNLIPDDAYTVTSESGFDYRYPFSAVPEPTSAWLLILGGLAGLVLHGRFRRPSAI